MTRTPATPGSSERPMPSSPVSFEEFLAWADEDTLAEWGDGEVILMSPTSADHQRLLKFLFYLVDAFVQAHRIGEVFLPPFLMRLPSRPSSREPDLLFVSNAHADRVKGAHLDGPADLVVEIVSPESDERDRVEKLREYEAGGVLEYWLIDLPRRAASFHQLGADGRYHAGSLGVDGFDHSTVLPGFRLRVAWLWERPLPPVAEALRQIGL